MEVKVSLASLLGSLSSTRVVGKNQHLEIGGKEGPKKDGVHPLSKAGWYGVGAPAVRRSEACEEPKPHPVGSRALLSAE